MRLEAAEVPGGLVVHVTDQGRGFPPQFRELAFERFSRADGSTAGAGLGLAMVAAIAHAHGGTATASNTPAGGADVALTVPAKGQPE